MSSRGSKKKLSNEYKRQLEYFKDILKPIDANQIAGTITRDILEPYK